MNSSGLQWYWHRLRAMSPAEVRGRLRRKARQWADGRRERDWTRVRLESSGAFPKVPPRAGAPEELRRALQRETEEILKGHWRAFGHLELKVDDPPKWHCDYLAGRDLATDRPAFELDHRALPAGADIKLVWELSRWQQLVRLAQAAHLLDDQRAARKCAAWLEDWVARNPPYRGWNWTSPLEAGLRLIQLTWIDALLERAAETEPPGGGTANERDTLRYELLPAHAWFTWRHRSFGSSANNHLLGELAGLIVATARWPALAQWGAPLERLHDLWEQEVLAQFASDGGNREQALHYQMFSWELCWQAETALLAAGRQVSSSVVHRLRAAAGFLREVQVRREPWDYGDSDSAFVTPLFASDLTAAREWCEWLDGAAASRSLRYWLGDSPLTPPRGKPEHAVNRDAWWVFEESGMAICELGFWFLRWDLSPLGYLSTAAHGHLDALHLSMWFKGVAMVIDPGTGAYYADAPLRTWLASRAAHNGPCPAGEDFPKRLGPFLWAEPHERPRIVRGRTEAGEAAGLFGELRLPSGLVVRNLTRVAAAAGDGWEVSDQFEPRPGGPREFTVCWQFTPGTFVKVLDQRRWAVKRGDVSIVVEAGPEWAAIRLVEERNQPALPPAAAGEERFAGTVSPAFRKVEWGPFLKLVARPGDKPCLFRTTFLASPRE